VATLLYLIMQAKTNRVSSAFRSLPSKPAGAAAKGKSAPKRRKVSTKGKEANSDE
jgi:DNA topoisomerase-3